MKKKIIFISLLITLLFSLAVINVKADSSQLNDTINTLNTSAGEVSAFKTQTSSNDYGVSFMAGQVGKIISLVLSFVGVLFLALMIYAGINWMMAKGNEQTVSESKDMITNAAIGIVVVLAAYAIVSFLGSTLLQ